MSETATIVVTKIRDGDGQPTCVWWEKVCPFFMTADFGIRDYCYWLQDPNQSRPELQRRDCGYGTTVPHQNCPI